MNDWFKIGESRVASSTRDKDTHDPVQVERGIYQDQSDKDHGLYEVIIPLALSDDLEAVVVYRELFGEYRYFVAAPENFEQSAEPTFLLVQTL